MRHFLGTTFHETANSLLKSYTIPQLKNEKLQPKLHPSVRELSTPQNSLVRVSGDLISCLSLHGPDVKCAPPQTGPTHFGCELEGASRSSQHARFAPEGTCVQTGCATW